MINMDELEYARIAASKAKRPFDDILADMLRARDVYGVNFRDYNKIRLYKFTEKTVFNQGVKLQELEEKEEIHYKNVCQSTGRTKLQVIQDLEMLNDNPWYEVNITQYDELNLYALPYRRLKAVLKKLKRKAELTTKLKSDLELIDKGLKSYSEIAEDMEEYYKVTQDTLTQSEIDEFTEIITKSCPEVLECREELCKLVSDMIICKRLMGYLDFEYIMFGFKDLSLPERRMFASNSDRTEQILKFNDRIKSELFDNKARTYEAFKEFYHREAVIVESDNDKENFIEFCSKHRIFVKKPLNGAMGKGVSLDRIEQGESIDEKFSEIREELGTFICEELIQAHDIIKSLNPDSVNTVRLPTVFDGEKVRVVWPFMKVGKKGSFVDNAGAGGIFVAVDETNGMCISDGIDEAGQMYTHHPDHGYAFRGFQLPNWDDALKLGEALAQKALQIIPEVRYIGWDISYTSDNRWIVIEGNAFGQLVRQGADRIGIRSELKALAENCCI